MCGPGCASRNFSKEKKAIREMVYSCPDCNCQLHGFKIGDQCWCGCDDGHWEYTKLGWKWIRTKTVIDTVGEDNDSNVLPTS